MVTLRGMFSSFLRICSFVNRRKWPQGKLRYTMLQGQKTGEKLGKASWRRWYFHRDFTIVTAHLENRQRERQEGRRSRDRTWKTQVRKRASAMQFLQSKAEHPLQYKNRESCVNTPYRAYIFWDLLLDHHEWSNTAEKLSIWNFLNGSVLQSKDSILGKIITTVYK